MSEKDLQIYGANGIFPEGRIVVNHRSMFLTSSFSVKLITFAFSKGFIAPFLKWLSF